MFRKIIFWFHLVCSIVTGIIIFIMSVTGVALTYQKQMTLWADKRACAVTPGDKSLLPIEELADIFLKARPDAILTSITIHSDPEMAATITTVPNVNTYVDPYTGDILGQGAPGMQNFFRIMTDWHRWLSLSGEKRSTGKAITGICNLAFLFIALTGIYLWWPRKWTLKTVRSISWFKTGLSSKGRDYNWHNVFGLWCLIPLILIIVSAVVISYPWASRVVFLMAGSQMTQLPARGKMPPGGGQLQRAPLRLEGLGNILEKVKNDAGTFRTISFQLPTESADSVSFSVDTGWGGQPQLRKTIVAELSTGNIIRRDKYSDTDPGLRARIWMRFVHTGEYYGITGQTIAGIASAGGIILVWTGIALSYRRYIFWLKRKKR